MSKQIFVGTYRWVFGLLALAAIAIGFVDRVIDADGDAVNYFSYFTILSNLLAAVLLLSGAWPWTGRDWALRDVLRGAAVLYMVVTGIVYGILLSGYEVLVPEWINTVEHRVMPVIIALDWLIDPPRHRRPLRNELVWLVFPIVYLIYTEIRGPFAGWYPYPFLDPRNGGYTKVVAFSIGITVTFLLVGLWVHDIGNRLSKRRLTRASSYARSG